MNLEEDNAKTSTLKEDFVNGTGANFTSNSNRTDSYEPFLENTFYKNGFSRYGCVYVYTGKFIHIAYLFYNLF